MLWHTTFASHGLSAAAKLSNGMMFVFFEDNRSASRLDSYNANEEFSRQDDSFMSSWRRQHAATWVLCVGDWDWTRCSDVVQWRGWDDRLCRAWTSRQQRASSARWAATALWLDSGSQWHDVVVRIWQSTNCCPHTEIWLACHRAQLSRSMVSCVLQVDRLMIISTLILWLWSRIIMIC